MLTICEDSMSSKFFPLHSQPVNLASDQCLELAKSWLKECERHEQCRTENWKQDPTFFHWPTYLIDVNVPRIVKHSTLARPGRYVALSYVWGKNQTYVLTKETLSEKCTSLDTSRLPKTILDAMEVTRRLDYSYLWVDALCIVQDVGEQM